MLNLKSKTMKFGKVAALAGALLMTACNDGGYYYGGGGGSSYGYYNSPGVTADRFTDALSYIDGTFYDSYVELYASETYRSYEPGQEDWFVIWDEKYDEYKAISLQYIRAIEYYDYMRNDDSLAAEFRAIESDDIAYGDINGDYYGDDYEVVDYDSYTDSFWGRNSGYEYEDESETTDVNLMAAKKEQAKFYKQAALVSFEFNVGISQAMSLVTLGSKIEGMKSKGELSGEDLAVLLNDVQKLTGVSVADVLSAKGNSEAKEKVLATASKTLGTSAANIEQKLLPELFGIEL